MGVWANMNEVTCIGRCKGCDRMRRVSDGVCEECLSAPGGRQRAERCHRCRTDPEYAAMTYNFIKTESGKKIFIGMFGLPPGVTAPERRPVPTGVQLV